MKRRGFIKKLGQIALLAAGGGQIVRAVDVDKPMTFTSWVAGNNLKPNPAWVNAPFEMAGFYLNDKGELDIYLPDGEIEIPRDEEGRIILELIYK